MAPTTPYSTKIGSMSEYSTEYIEWARSRKMSKRAREALEVMIGHGAVSTVELQTIYHLNHPPRALGDLKDAGISFEKKLVPDGNGKRMAQYHLTGTINTDADSEAPRKPIPKKVKEQLLKEDGPRCKACNGEFKPTVLQVDHRIPFRIGGDPDQWSESTVMLLCPSDNRAKSWTCEHCFNWEKRDPSICKTCYWSHPDGDYEHIAGEQQRRVAVIWQGPEVAVYDRFKAMMDGRNSTVEQIIKQLVENEANHEL